jgi:hypothetical protein
VARKHLSDAIIARDCKGLNGAAMREKVVSTFTKERRQAAVRWPFRAVTHIAISLSRVTASVSLGREQLLPDSVKVSEANMVWRPPKCQFRPFMVCFISESCLARAFLVELATAMMVASTVVPARSRGRPLRASRQSPRRLHRRHYIIWTSIMTYDEVSGLCLVASADDCAPD